MNYATCYLIAVLHATACTTAFAQPTPSGHPTPSPTVAPPDDSGVRKAEAAAAVYNGINAADRNDLKPPVADPSRLTGGAGGNPQRKSTGD